MALIGVDTAKILSIVYCFLYTAFFLVFFLLGNPLYWVIFGAITLITVIGTYFFRKQKYKYAEWLFAIAGILTLPLGGPLAVCAMTANSMKSRYKKKQKE